MKAMGLERSKDSKTILAVEDESNLLGVLVEGLKGWGFTAFGATDGEEGLKLALRERPDLILLDILMPKMNGLEMFAVLRRHPWGKRVPVIFLTNVSETDTVTPAVLANGPTSYLVKTEWEIDKVLQRIQDTLDRQ
jgi:DNA-binding response OmpR family regulator